MGQLRESRWVELNLVSGLGDACLLKRLPFGGKKKKKKKKRHVYMPVRSGSPLMFVQGLNPIWPVDFLAFRTLRMKNHLYAHSTHIQGSLASNMSCACSLA